MRASPYKETKGPNWSGESGDMGGYKGWWGWENILNVKYTLI